MSYVGTMADAKAAIASVEVSENTHSSSGSSIRDGHSSPGGAAASAKPSGETQMVGRLRAGINKPRTRTDTLTRKYAASGK